jgi:hypothetical protein
MVTYPFERRVRSGKQVIAMACSMAGLAIACGPTASTLPGTALGTYNVSGSLQSNSCGGGLGAPNPWNFTAQMSQDGTTLYWEPSGGTQIYGAMSSSTKVDITSTQTANVDATEGGAEGPCDLQSTTAVDLTLSASSPPAAFTGTITYTFAASTGVSSTTDCTDQLTASGGTYDTLPCTLSYTVTGSRQ